MKDGYYWVKFDSQWTPLKYDTKRKSFVDNFDDLVIKEWIDEVGDYIETPDKYKDGK